jgi:hypothetical protein
MGAPIPPMQLQEIDRQNYQENLYWQGYRAGAEDERAGVIAREVAKTIDDQQDHPMNPAAGLSLAIGFMLVVLVAVLQLVASQLPR